MVTALVFEHSRGLHVTIHKDLDKLAIRAEVVVRQLVDMHGLVVFGRGELVGSAIFIHKKRRYPRRASYRDPLNYRREYRYGPPRRCPYARQTSNRGRLHDKNRRHVH